MLNFIIVAVVMFHCKIFPLHPQGKIDFKIIENSTVSIEVRSSKTSCICIIIPDYLNIVIVSPLNPEYHVITYDFFCEILPPSRLTI